MMVTQTDINIVDQIRQERKPEYDQWAEALLQEIYYAPDEGHRVAIIKEHLLKAVQRGYVDGTENGWAYEQDKEYTCRRESKHNRVLTCPECGQ